MNAILSLLGATVLLLISMAAVLGIIILVLYEAQLIVRLGGRLYKSARLTHDPRVGSEPTANGQGAD
jgi:hypothetical protein